MVRAPYIDKNGTKRGSWSGEEDQRLIDYIQKHGHANWRQLPKFAGLTRCGKSCRLRWMNYLRPNLKRGNYTQQEEKTIIELHKKHGNKWSLIAENLPGRSDNEIKNYWHSNLKKFSKFNEEYKLKCKESETRTTTTSEVVSVESHHILESSLSMSSEVSNNKANSPSCSSSHAVSISKVNLYREEESVVTWQTIDGFSTNFWTEPFVSDNAFSDQDYFQSSCYQVEAEDPFLLWYW